MKKISLLLLVLLLTLNMQARKTGKPLHLGRYDCRVTQPIKRHMPEKISFSLYLDSSVLYINAEENLVFSVSFIDADENVLSESFFSGLENELQVPNGASAVLVNTGASVYIAYF